ncbi:MULTISPECIES: fimbria/pilus outer membrane usher protein [unclassified Cedecea]|uniref:fimbria/pilus outer membrane usher protein n=1 Tax=unclassified Cedecea TaxID=2649846 RepID=UPI0030190C44
MMSKKLCKAAPDALGSIGLCFFFAAAVVTAPWHAYAAEKTLTDNVEFNTSFLDTGYTGKVDLSQFGTGNGMLPGKYLVEVYLNDDLKATEKVTFAKQATGKVTPCLSPGLLARLHIMSTAVQNTDKLSQSGCTAVEEIIPSARVTFDSGLQALTIHVPQQDIQKTARGTVAPALWQSGSTAAFASYNANAYQSETNGKAYRSQYLSLNTGLNLGGWYFRHNGSLSQQTGSADRYQSVNSYVQHDISAISGRVQVGQANTSGRLFDTLSYTGVSLFSDDQMLPESQRGYAPEIRGIAHSTSRVTVRQAGNIIYETTVPAGAFVINDLYPTGYGGDLNVTVRESNGAESTFLVPYASVADLLRPGASRYEAVAGKYRSAFGKDGQAFYQATWQQGVTNSLSVYGGSQLSNDYQAWQAGSALSLPVGALSMDVTHARTKTTRRNLEGQSYKITYNKLISDTKSNISLAAYRFSTRNYLDFSQAIQYQNYEQGDAVFSGLLYRTKNRFSLTYSQGLADGWGSLYGSGISQDYWNRSGSDMQYQLGYSNSFGSLAYTITASRSRVMDGAMETSWLLSFSLPLGETRPVSFSAALSRDANGRFGEQASVTGTAGEKQQVTWGLAGTNDKISGSAGSVSGQYLSPWTSVSASASAGRDTRTISAGMVGSVIAHPHGVTLSPYTGNTWVVIHAPGAANAEVVNSPGVTLDAWGNAAVPASMPYQTNTIGIDPKHLSSDVELESTTQSVIPRSGAVVLAEFGVREGKALLFTPADGKSGLPFGTNVTDSQGNSVGTTGQGGMVYARVNALSGKLFATFNKKDKAETCIIAYQAAEQGGAMQKMTYVCGQ